MIVASCSSCGVSLEKGIYFSPWIFKHVKMGEKDPIPWFCSPKCMVKWSAEKKNVTEKSVKKSFKNYKGHKELG